MDLRAVLLVLIVAGMVWYYFNFTVMFILALLGLFIAFSVFVYGILRDEGKIKSLTKWFKKMEGKYLKLEARFFRWIDGL
ncbi:MAG: hypothetical protein WCO07_00095 [bacterium]